VIVVEKILFCVVILWWKQKDVASQKTNQLDKKSKIIFQNNNYTFTGIICKNRRYMKKIKSVLSSPKSPLYLITDLKFQNCQMWSIEGSVWIFQKKIQRLLLLHTETFYKISSQFKISIATKFMSSFIISIVCEIMSIFLHYLLVVLYVCHVFDCEWSILCLFITRNI